MNTEIELTDKEPAANPAMPANFIEIIINEDIKTGKYGGRVHTPFSPGA